MGTYRILDQIGLEDRRAHRRRAFQNWMHLRFRRAVEDSCESLLLLPVNFRLTFASRVLRRINQMQQVRTLRRISYHHDLCQSCICDGVRVSLWKRQSLSQFKFSIWNLLVHESIDLFPRKADLCFHQRSSKLRPGKKPCLVFVIHVKHSFEIVEKLILR